MKSVLEWVETRAENQKEQVVYSSSTEKITFGQLCLAAQQVGIGIAERFSDIGVPIGVALGKDILTIVAFLGVVYSGNFYAPVDTTVPKARAEKIFSSLCPQAVVTDEKNLNFVQESLKEIQQDCEILLLEDLLQVESDTGKLAAIRKNVRLTDPLYILYTSGSSGNPKGVVTSHLSLINYIESYSKVMGIGGSDIIGNQAPLDYISAIRDIYVPLFTGCRMHLFDKELFLQPDVLFQQMNEQHVTSIGWSSSTLTILSKLRAFQKVKPDYVNKICFSGSVISGKVLRQWQENLSNCKFVNQYGPTETTASCSYYEVDHFVSEDEVLPIGIPYDNYKIFLLNPDDTPTAQGKLGEICIGGIGLAFGYYRDPERTQKAFVQNPLNSSYREVIYKSGDIGRFREDGLLEFHGRMDRQVKVLGHRVELDEVEAAAMQISGVSEAVAVYDHALEKIHLCYSGAADTKQLMQGLKEILPMYMVPRKMHHMEIPKLPNGKIDFTVIKQDLEITN